MSLIHRIENNGDYLEWQYYSQTASEGSNLHFGEIQIEIKADIDEGRMFFEIDEIEDLDFLIKSFQDMRHKIADHLKSAPKR